MILHVATPSPIVAPFVKLIDEEFDGKEHRFWFDGSTKICKIEKKSNIYFCGSGVGRKIKGYTKLILELHFSEKVIIHGLFNIKLVLMLFICPWLLSKCFWVIWGGDLYAYQKPRRSLVEKIKENIRKRVIKRIGHLVSYLPVDIELARKWYGARGLYHECLMYPSNLINPAFLGRLHADQPRHNYSGLNVLVGNSADPSNNHLEVLKTLLPYKDKNINIYVPLSYGDEAHAKMVMEQGEKWFGDTFFPLTTFMKFEKYIGFLKSIDVAVFNHKRQQAMGNTITLLGLGATVYMRNDVSQWHLFKGLNIKIFDLSDFDMSVMRCEDVENNKLEVLRFFNRKKLVDQYAEIFRT